MQSDATSGIVNGAVPSQSQNTLSLAAMVFIALQFMDLITTFAAFSHGGTELNPVVSSLIPWTGRILAVLVSKVILISLVLLLNRRTRILRFANILYTGVVAWNLVIVFALA